MDNERKIKNFSDFVPKFRKMLNSLFIVGNTKGGLFRKSKQFEVQIYYTPLKGKIIEIKLDGIEQDKLPFKVGDNVTNAREWCSSNGYTITFDRKKI